EQVPQVERNPLFEPHVLLPATARSVAGPRHAPDLVVLFSLPRIRENAVCLGDVFHLLLGVLVTGVLIGVELPSELLVGALDLVGGCVLADTEHLVEVLVEPRSRPVHCCFCPTFTIAGRITRPPSL